MSNKKVLYAIVLLFICSQNYAQNKSYKRGVAYGYHSVNDMQKVSENISWWYNWGAQPDNAIRSTYQNYNVDFTPMAWNGTGISAVNNWVNQDSKVKYILGFNEPNFKDQANMTPSQAATAWPAFQSIAKSHNLKTVGPAVNYCGNCVSENGTTYTNAFKYLDDFFAACTDCEVDYIALHWYGSGNSIVGYINDARKYNKPIWVTEFASWDYSNPVQSVEEQKKYLAGTVNFLERDPDVYRYSWFIGRTNAGATSYPYIDLYGSDGKLTELGEIYMKIPVYDPNYKFQIPGKIEAEEYNLMSGLFAEITEDTDGFLNLGWTENNDWATYKINVATTGTYTISARVAGSDTGVIDFLVDNQLKVALNTPNTGGWQKWETVSSTIDLIVGEHVLKMLVKDAGFNINWISISNNNAPSTSFDIKTVGETCPNKKNGQIVVSAKEQGVYKAKLNGVTSTFALTKVYNNLASGSYNLCVSVVGESSEQCYTFEILEGKNVSGKASIINSKTVEITLDNGTPPFSILVNNQQAFETLASQFNVTIKQGDVVEVKTAKPCEGVVTKKIDFFNEIEAYPNPTSGIFEITLPLIQDEVQIAIYNMQSSLISNRNYTSINGKVKISLEENPSGIYMAKIGEGNSKTLKIIKI
ncbi:glycosyl hydrolase [Lutibacter sp.]|uniref:glycosyl hydrolase n=1 Tax=Lutibacter sp. TaxID=1925666 RepID=UPI001A230CFD|nr:glycosyl hydrolase [Lutibacter sp.]MBI9039927.1 carbohydrate-binding protein [Lutibacter sp.]